ncbi:hypothetical protein F3K40_15395 [Streptomyces sp. LBUM 1478]|uniref:hypothetical protein n=1 Tax=Streptomyces scabiei TaxID=1930 RepID=UPI001B31E8F5|nr:hypothetical protein [Streptomyces sp. LBUM 1478]MBP5930431.1 hypothetical protein [Streptomyces sp. LBUM 1479]
MKHTSGPAWLLAGAHLTAGLFLAHAGTVTVNHGATVQAAVLYGTAALAAAAAYGSATGTRRAPARTRPGTGAEDMAGLTTCRCDRWWTSFGTEHDTWCPNYQTRSPT